MKAKKKAELQKEIQVVESGVELSEYRCPRCRDNRHLILLHDFGMHPKEVWEIVYCDGCGHDIETKDITSDYESDLDRTED